MGYVPGEREKKSPMLWWFQSSQRKPLVTLDGVVPSWPRWATLGLWLCPCDSSLATVDSCPLEHWPPLPPQSEVTAFSSLQGILKFHPPHAPYSTIPSKNPQIQLRVKFSHFLCGTQRFYLMTSECISSPLKSLILIQLPEAGVKKKKSQHFGSNKQPFTFKNAPSVSFFLKNLFFLLCAHR